MTLQRSYYGNTFLGFYEQDDITIFGYLAKCLQFINLEPTQKFAWEQEIQILKKVLQPFRTGHIFFEFSIPRMGKRVDVVLIIGGIVFLLEFKVGDRDYSHYGQEQVLDYALDLKNFHEGSHHVPIVPILVATEANDFPAKLIKHLDDIYEPLKANPSTITSILQKCLTQLPSQPIDPITWANSSYRPTPTIIEAAQALYRGHHVEEISRSDAGAHNLSDTTQAILQIIKTARSRHEKAICFVTGVPGAGKTLAGLNIANQRLNVDDIEHAVFLSGNGPLVTVLTEALARDEVEQKRSVGLRKNVALANAKSFIQNIHHFRDNALIQAGPPHERVVIFDEAQRAWNRNQTSDFMKQKRQVANFAQLEPEFLIDVMNRFPDWAVIICLVGGGQEINKGEAGLLEWFNALRTPFTNWHIYVSNQLQDVEYTQNTRLFEDLENQRLHFISNLHLAVTVRSFRSEKVSEFIKAILDRDIKAAKQIYSLVHEKYPIVLTRDFNKAKDWLKRTARGSERYGLLASSGAHRLRPHGVYVNGSIDVANWFLNEMGDVRSSFALEEVATEFDIQGLELDWTCVAWDANFVYQDDGWHYRDFRGMKWYTIRSETNQMYLKNAYRVLLTRARQGIVIYIPEGSDEDPTRKRQFYDPTFQYLASIGIPVI